MTCRPLLTIALLGAALPGRSPAANYSLAPAVLDHGGRQAGSENYSASFSAAPGGDGGSSNYRLRSGYAAQLFDPDPLPAVDFVLPESLAADGSGKSVSATAVDVGALNISYEGRGFTNYDLSSAAPATPGLYRVNASAVSQEYVGFASRDFVISGPLAAADALTKPADNSDISITTKELLANDTRVHADGSVSSDGLLIVSVAPGTGNTVFLGEEEDAGWIFFMPSPNSTEEFTYVVSDGLSTASAVVTVASLAESIAFTLQVVGRGIPVFDGVRTSMSMDFIGVPGQNYEIQWSKDLNTWVSAGTSASGLTGSFTVNISGDGDHLNSWNQSLFFRAKR